MSSLCASSGLVSLQGNISILFEAENQSRQLQELSHQVEMIPKKSVKNGHIFRVTSRSFFFYIPSVEH